ncbi:MAG: MBL fold metallo-hydrolase [Candidatus Riflebacteria bacterium]|nr:MBL fold metallo-hydrolase [Candidatus Riflebacteria bacterium]
MAKDTQLSIKFLGSGSKGNCALINAGGRFYLFDAGLSRKKIEKGLAEERLSLSDLDGIFISHDHGDHVCGLEKILKKQKLPVITSQGTYNSLVSKGFDISEAIFLKPDREFEFDGTRFWPFSIPHDAAEPIGMRIERSGNILGIASDIGHLTPSIFAHLSDCDILCLESNYDEEMLAGCSYPFWLKSRIRGPLGHLANSGTRGILSRLKKPLKNLFLIHLSQESNTPELVLENLEIIRKIENLRETQILVALQNEPSVTVSAAAQQNKVPRVVSDTSSLSVVLKPFQQRLSTVPEFAGLIVAA